MKTPYYLKIVLLLILAATSCSKDSKQGFSVADLQVSLEENPSDGQLIASLVPGNTEGLEFSIVNQSPENAFLLNANTGEIRVNEASLFDFETNPELTLTAFVSDGIKDETARVTVNLDNMDDIFHFLSASKQTYLEADAGNWIEITQEEYDALEAGLNKVSFVGPGRSSYAFSSTLNYSYTAAGFTSVRHEERHQVVNNGYIFAFKYMNGTGFGWIPGHQVKQADGNPLNPLTDLGNPLPFHRLGDVSYFVLKGNNTPASTSGPGYIGFYSTAPVAYWDGTGAYMGEGNLSQINPPDNSQEVRFNLQYEALISTQKQWD
ncbi:cadherin repeat domain-containing protein [Poritiphilus flavus]|uniref:Cadherin domain-containing protein n=1 Tax=Poritiphilus flavus TaxID=2697053 RepID=A0A6L9EER6_9FLAO|nr:cadherin repeat domain-containing protein [Poritiphilus flavus]NAS13161.1 hypothetical protein [Poritiphilus flavus]